MAPILNNSTLARVTDTQIWSMGTVTDVVAMSSDQLALVLDTYIDQSLFGFGWRVKFTPQIIEMPTHRLVLSIDWRTGLDGLHQWAPYIRIIWGPASAAGFGVTRGADRTTGPLMSGDGLYLYRPYFQIVRGGFETGGYTRRSLFAVAEEHYFMLEDTV